MNQENLLKMKDIEYRNSSGSSVSGQDAIELTRILSLQYKEEHPDKPGGECPWCHSEEYCEHWSGLGWKNPNYIAQ
jgi:hypothetical protein